MTTATARADHQQEARERLLLAMERVGIMPTDAIGVVLMQVHEAAAGACATMVDAQVQMWETMARWENELQRVRADLASGRSGIEQLKLVGEQKIKAWETVAERERQASINKVIEGIVVDLKPRLHAELATLLPAAEKDFLASARYQLWGWIALSSLVVLIAGIGVGFSLNWRSHQLAGYCEAHQHHDPKGADWCFLP